ncbi:thymidylate synthase [Methylobacterium oxalidis]|uniref:thymidylate synthase n=1 Tax=Methylobacterium oxalidis TaxID=944322 RepID=UPI0011BDEF4B|nr:thymidylate synthase [Methylobacterium oxalidis]GJE32254.1 Thymidylate synthase [Methylobacterium oxalidis]
MRFSSNILDDLLRKVYPKLLASKTLIKPSRGDALELAGVLLELKNPRARISRSETRGRPFSCLGELCWYLSGSDSLDFIRHYVPAYEEETEDGSTVHGAYGPRIFNQRGHNQLKNVVDLLTEHPDSRRAVIQLFNAEDISRRHKEIPCTCTLQFLVRDRCLHLFVTMRSNDAHKGLAHDVFCFTMIQEIVAVTLGCKLGTYKHFAGSLHLYEEDWSAARQYLTEGIQSTVSMPSMPAGDPWSSLSKLLKLEAGIRNGTALQPDWWDIDSYWADLARLLQIFAATGDKSNIDAIESKMAFDRYTPYIRARKTMKRRSTRRPT